MANITTQFNCGSGNGDYGIIVENVGEISVIFYNYKREQINSILLDIPTAIKFSKTLRTEINKIKEDSDGNR